LIASLGVAACRQGVSTRYVTGCGLANELLEAQNERALRRVLQRYIHYGLLVLDELGYVPFSKESSELLFQVLAERHERGSGIITTNLGFADLDPSVWCSHAHRRAAGPFDPYGVHRQLHLGKLPSQGNSNSSQSFGKGHDPRIRCIGCAER
jgi:hypothetical protein